MNKPTIDTVRDMQIGAISSLSADTLALMQVAISDHLEEAKAIKDKFDAAIKMRYDDYANDHYRRLGKDTGIVHLIDEGLDISVETPKKVKWDQAELAKVYDQLIAWNENPLEYITKELKVSETKFNAWPEKLKALFEPARTVETGKRTYKFKTEE